MPSDNNTPVTPFQVDDWKWDVIGKWPFQWVPRFVAKLRERDLRPIEGPDLWVASDYSGAQRSGRFSTIAVLLADPANSPDWEHSRREVRQRFLPDGRRMSFKGLNDSNRRSALIPFLDVSDLFRGATVVLAIDKRATGFAGVPQFFDGLKERGMIRANWKRHSFEHMIAVTHMISVLLGIVTREGQTVTWISDADECFASEAHKQDCARMMGVFSSMYVKHKMGQLAVGTTELDEGDRFEEDLTAIPDLAAGAIRELFDGMAADYGKVPGIAAYGPRTLTRKTELITSWFFHPNKWHQKIACVLQKIPGKGLQLGTIWESDDPSSVTIAPSR